MSQLPLPTLQEAGSLANSAFEEAYRCLTEDYWNGRTAYTFRFDNLRRLAETYGDRREVDQNAIAATITESLQSEDFVSIYAGVPWCVQTCGFCDLAFARNPSMDERRQYVSLLHQEISNYNNVGLSEKKINSCYFGGGTPTVLDAELLGEYLDGVLSSVQTTERTVITCEVSPATVTPAKLEVLRTRVNRLSLGVQSTDTKLRQQHGRKLSRERLLEKLREVLAVFPMVNADVMYGLEGDSFEAIYQSLVDLIELGVPSITYYRTELFPGTKSFDQGRANPWKSLGEREARRFYFFGRVLLEAAGYTEEPLGWFIKRQGAATTSSWSAMINNWGKVVPYFGFGQGAFSLATSFWMRNATGFPIWEDMVHRGSVPVNYVMSLNVLQQFLARFMRSLRAFRGVSLSFLVDQYPGDPSNLKSFLARSTEMNLLAEDGDYLRLTKAGESLVHVIIDDFCDHVLRSENGSSR